MKCYFVEGVGLTCVLVDGLCGPQVTCEGIRLIGRVASELDAEMEARAVERDLGIWYCPTGDLGWPDFEFDRGAPAHRGRLCADPSRARRTACLLAGELNAAHGHRLRRRQEPGITGDDGESLWGQVPGRTGRPHGGPAEDRTACPAP